MTQEVQPQLTSGQKAAGVTFNPSGLKLVDKIKQSSADLLDVLMEARSATTDGETIAQYTLAIRSIQQGKMWGVNAATLNLPPRK